MTPRNLGIDFLRFVAIVLVINSHMDAFYPIPQLGTGGALGNALFFMLSAFGLAQSQQRNPQDFSTYFKNRIIKIYPAIWIVTIVLITPLALYYHFSNPSILINFKTDFNWGGNLLNAFSILFFPPPAFWFLQALMLYYIIGYFYIYKFDDFVKKILLAVLLLAYSMLYIKNSNFNYLAIEQILEFKLIFYILIFLFGIELAKRPKHVNSNTWKDWIGLAVCMIIIYGHKLLMMQGWAGGWQFIQQLAIFPSVFFGIRLANCNAINRIMQTPWVSKFIKLCASMTLELYIVHGPIRELINPSSAGFPGNVVIYLPMVFLAAYVVRAINRSITTRMLSRDVSKLARHINIP